MRTTAARHPVLANDIARSWISIGTSLLLVTAAILALGFVAPAVIRDMGSDQLIRLNYYALWSVFCLTYIVLSLVAFSRLEAVQLRSLTASTDPGASRWRRLWWALNGGGAVWWALAGALITLLTLVELSVSGQSVTPLLIAACVTVVVMTVALFIVAFAVNYAREDAVRGGLEFTGGGGTRFSDYLYFSIQLTTTFGVSDVQVLRRGMRRIVSMHSLIAFTFNTVIVALLVSVLVGRLG